MTDTPFQRGNHDDLVDPGVMFFGDLHVARGDGPDRFKPVEIVEDPQNVKESDFPHVTRLWNIVGGTRNEPGYALDMVERDGVWVIKVEA